MDALSLWQSLYDSNFLPPPDGAYPPRITSAGSMRRADILPMPLGRDSLGQASSGPTTDSFASLPLRPPSLSARSFLSTRSDSDSLPSEFRDWYEMYQFAVTLMAFRDLFPYEKEALSIHVLHLLFYNASFTAAESGRLDYQATPMCYSESNSYLRASETSFMQVLSARLSGVLQTEHFFLVDHASIRDVLRSLFAYEEYMPPVDEAATTALSQRVADVVAPHLLDGESIDDFRKKNKGIYVDIGHVLERLAPGTKAASAKKIILELYETIEHFCRDEIIKRYFSGLNASPDFLEAMVACYRAYEQEDDSGYLKELRLRVSVFQPMLVSSVESELEKYQSFRAKLTAPDSLSGQDFDVFRIICHDANQKLRAEANRNKALFLRNLNAWLRVNSAEVMAKAEEKIAVLRARLTDTISDDQLLELFDSQIKPIKPAIQNLRDLKDMLCIGYVASVDGQCVFVTPDRSDAMQHLLHSVLGNIGYFPEHITFNRRLLRALPLPELVRSSIEEQVTRAEADSGIATHLKTLLVRLDRRYQTRPRMVPALHQRFLRNAVADHIVFSKLTGDRRPYVRIYARSIHHLLSGLGVFNIEIPRLMGVVLKRIGKYLRAAVTDAAHDNMAQFVRDIHNVHDALILAIGILPPERVPPLDATIRALMPRENLTQVGLFDYGMKSFTQSFNALRPYIRDAHSAYRVQVFKDNYYELLFNMQKFTKLYGETQDFRLNRGKSLEALDVEADCIFIDTHPNNAAEIEIHAHNILELFHKLDPTCSGHFDKPRTIIADITLNAIADSEVQTIVSAAQPYIGTGTLNLVMVQSLTKFAHLGSDKFSGGLVCAYNDRSDYWKPFNEQLQTYLHDEPVDPLIERYFASMFRFANAEQHVYIAKVRENTGYLYSRLQARYHGDGLTAEGVALQVSLNDDPGTCYVGLNHESFFKSVTCIVGRKPETDVFAAFNKSVMKELLASLAAKMGLPITLRMSFGFPLSNFSDCDTTIRFTIGIEDQRFLDRYADLLVYACKNLKDYPHPEELVLDSKKRKAYFESVVSKAPGH